MGDINRARIVENKCASYPMKGEALLFLKECAFSAAIPEQIFPLSTVTTAFLEPPRADGLIIPIFGQT
jgi:hypothetical protein